MQSPQIRDAILLCRQLSKQFEFLVCLNTFDLLALVHDAITIPGLAQGLDQLSKLQVVSALSQEKISPHVQLKAVQPPYGIARFPPSYAVPQGLHVASNFGPIATHHTFPNAGTIMVKYENVASATFSYGALMPGNFVFTSGSSDADTISPLAPGLPRPASYGLPPPHSPPRTLRHMPESLPTTRPLRLTLLVTSQ